MQHKGVCSGSLQPNEDITCTDNEGHVVNFGMPEIEVDCGEGVFPEPCPEPVDIVAGGGEDAVEYDAGLLSQVKDDKTKSAVQSRRNAALVQLPLD